MVVERGGSSKPVRLTLMLDGYSAPVTAGNFVDLVPPLPSGTRANARLSAPKPLEEAPNAALALFGRARAWRAPPKPHHHPGARHRPEAFSPSLAPLAP